MGKITIQPYPLNDEQKWNSFVENSNGGTIFHRMDFLAYHGQKFAGKEHHVAWFKGQTIFGIMPMALIRENDALHARSPYGASYGGPIFNRPLSHAESQEIISGLIEYLEEHNIESCRLTFPIPPCFREYSDTFYLVLLEHGFKSVNRDVSCVLDLSIPDIDRQMEKRARYAARKARNSGIRVEHQGNPDCFWNLMGKTYQKFGKTPTHTQDEYQWLCDHLPDRIGLELAYLDDVPIAGVGYFVINKLMNSSFYLCQDPKLQHIEALSVLVYDILHKSQQDGYRWFDFGLSSVNMKSMENIFMFKEGFGAVGRFRETYVWEKPQRGVNDNKNG